MVAIDICIECFFFCLAQRVYVGKDPNGIWKCNDYDKTKPFGIAIHSAFDGFIRSFPDWAIDHFKDLVHDGTFIPDNIFHMECIRFG